MRQNNPIDLREQDRKREAVEQSRKVASAQEAEDLTWLMSDKRGRRIVWRLLELAGVYRSSFTGNSETFYREGQRMIGLKLLADLHEFTPDAYLSMLKEHKKK